MNIRAVGTWLLVKPEEFEETKTINIPGFVMTDKSKPRPTTARVIKVGEGVVGINEGDKIFWKKWNGEEYKRGDETLFWIHPEDILAIID